MTSSNIDRTLPPPSNTPSSASTISSGSHSVDLGATGSELAAGAAIGSNATHSPTTTATIGIASNSSYSLPDPGLPSCFSMTAEQLRNHLEDLPRELYDEIKALTFAFDFTSEGRCIDQVTYQLPMQLQIDHKLRTEFIQQYYGADQEWILVARTPPAPRGPGPCKIFQDKPAIAWLKSLSQEALSALDIPQNERDHFERDHFDTFYLVYVGQKWDKMSSSRRNISQTRRMISHRRRSNGLHAVTGVEPSSQWAWSPGPAEYGRFACKFWRSVRE